MHAPASFALVNPREISPNSGEILLLADFISDYIYSDVRTVRLTGRGKSMALAHLAAEFSSRERVRFLDGERPRNNDDWDLTVYSYSERSDPDVEIRIANWSQDDVIEYLMSKDVTRCKSVMSRLRDSKDLWLGNGSPRVLSVVLDLMIESDEINGVEQAILASFDSIDVPFTWNADGVLYR